MGSAKLLVVFALACAAVCIVLLEAPTVSTASTSPLVSPITGSTLFSSTLPTPTPTPAVVREFLHIDLGSEEWSGIIGSNSASSGNTIVAVTSTMHFPAAVSTRAPIEPAAGDVVQDGDLVDNWQLLLQDGFEGAFPPAGCEVRDSSNDGFERFWGRDDYRRRAGAWAGWPAAGGAQQVDPEYSSYPNNMDTLLACGPFNVTNAQKMLVKFGRLQDIGDTDDYLELAFSTDGINFPGQRLEEIWPG